MRWSHLYGLRRKICLRLRRAMKLIWKRFVVFCCWNGECISDFLVVVEINEISHFQQILEDLAASVLQCCDTPIDVE